MNPWQAAVRDFHVATGSTVGESPGFRDERLRFDLIREEWHELLFHSGWSDTELGLGRERWDESLPGAIDSLVDLIYVILGTAVAWGIDLDPYFWEVQRANMDKAGGPKRADGKVLKPEGWRPPDIEGILARVSHEWAPPDPDREAC